MNINTVVAETINVVLRRVGLALRFEYITPGDAKRQLEQNPELLRAYGLSQKMSGDTDETIEEAKGRPFVNTLIERIKEGRWRFYFGIIARCPNAAIIDGVTRMIAIAKAGIPVWVLTYNAADPKDFYMYDDEASARTAKDIFGTMGYPSEISGVLSVITKKAAGATNEDGEYKRVIRDKWVRYFEAHKDALIEAFQFVKTTRGEPKVIRKNLTALMYFKWVSRPGCKHAKDARRLLTVYKTQLASTPEEREMVILRDGFSKFAELHERNQCLPLFTRVLRSLLTEGKGIRYNIDKSDINGSYITRVIYAVDKKTAKKKAAAGR